MVVCTLTFGAAGFAVGFTKGANDKSLDNYGAVMLNGLFLGMGGALLGGLVGAFADTALLTAILTKGRK